MAGGTWKPSGGNTADQAAAPATQSSVQQASFREPAVNGEASSDASPASTLKLNGMRVNDATQVNPPAAPAQFVPPAQMTPISQAAPTAGTGVPSGVVVSSAQASDNVQPGTPQTADSGSTLNWQTR
jgi:hypothetical protein